MAVMVNIGTIAPAKHGFNEAFRIPVVLIGMVPPTLVDRDYPVTLKRVGPSRHYLNLKIR